MAMLPELSYELRSDEPASTNDYDFHTVTFLSSFWPMRSNPPVVLARTEHHIFFYTVLWLRFSCCYLPFHFPAEAFQAAGRVSQGRTSYFFDTDAGMNQQKP